MRGRAWIRKRPFSFTCGTLNKFCKANYLGEGQTVLVLVLILDLEVIQSFALGRRLGQGLDALDVAGREKAMAAVQLPMVPVLVHLAAQNDDVTLVELEVARLLALVAVESFPAGQLGDILLRDGIEWSLTNTAAS